MLQYIELKHCKNSRSKYRLNPNEASGTATDKSETTKGHSSATATRQSIFFLFCFVLDYSILHTLHVLPSITKSLV
jgi:hypothetical protein